MSHLILLVHGMGKHGKGWSADAQKVLKDAYGALPANPAKPGDFDAQITFAEVCYDDVFARVVKQWNDLAKDFTKLGAVADSPWISDLGKIMAEPTTKGGKFFQDYALDVLLYRYFPLIREAAQIKVARQVVEAVEPFLAPGSGRTWSIMAHSLGTAVVHDTLKKLYAGGGFAPSGAALRDSLSGESTAEINKAISNPWRTTNRQAQALFMVANVSHILEETTDDVYNSLVKPGYTAQQDRCTRYYFNFRHKLDPFPAPNPFDPPPDWGKSPTLQRVVRVEDLDHLHEANVHALEHYLIHPRVYWPIFHNLLGEIVSEKQAIDLIAKFRQVKLPTDQIEDQIRSKLNYQLPKAADTWRNLLDIVKDYLTTIVDLGSNKLPKPRQP